MKQLFTGDTWCEPITLKKKSTGVVDLTGATIKAAVVDSDGSLILQTVTVSNTETGSDWTNGIIIPVFASVDTDGIQLNALNVSILFFEIQVEIGGKKQTYPRVQFQVVKGAIS